MFEPSSRVPGNLRAAPHLNPNPPLCLIMFEPSSRVPENPPDEERPHPNEPSRNIVKASVEQRARLHWTVSCSTLPNSRSPIGRKARRAAAPAQQHRPRQANAKPLTWRRFKTYSLIREATVLCTTGMSLYEAKGTHGLLFYFSTRQSRSLVLTGRPPLSSLCCRFRP